ncbi:MAG TPA: arginine--tRNA ligase [bacterium]|nr:arginine--tRNA ligase [bacterium]
MCLQEIKKIIAQKLDIDSQSLIYPQNHAWGDFSLPIFKLAKENNLSPDLITKKLQDKILSDKELSSILLKTEIVGAYLNFFLKPDYLANKILTDVLKYKDKYGWNNLGQKKVTVFEFSNVNTHKDFHIGHLRNICFGEAMVNIFKANGFCSYPVSYINDFGIHTAKAIWSYKRLYSKDLNKCYAETVKQMNDNPKIAEEVSLIMADIEKHQGKNYYLWKKTRSISLKEFNEVYKKNNIKFKKTYFESQVINKGFKIVKKLIDDNILVKSQGAIIADLEIYQLGVLPIIRQDGTALYPVADLALAEAKELNFKGLRDSYIVVDIRQSLYFKQLAKILSLAGYQQKINHLPYEFITLPDGMMSSRLGNAISYFSLYEKIKDCLIIETKKRHENWSDKKIEKNCQSLAVAILKFEMLKVSPAKIITFDINEAVKFDGFNALYILYGLVRIKSLLKKAKFKNNNKFNGKFLDTKIEQDLIFHLAKYPEVIIRSQQQYDQSEIVKYLFELFQMFNDYYQQVKILSGDPKVLDTRLNFIYSLSLVAINALNLLGIKPLNEI